MTNDAEWFLAQRKDQDGIHLLRIARLPASFDFQVNAERIHVLWEYRSGNTDEPSPADLDEMEEFENAVCQELAAADHGVLVAAFTEPGYRELVFYVPEVEPFLQMLNDIPSENRFPVEIHQEDDPKGEFYKSYARRIRRPPGSDGPLWVDTGHIQRSAVE